MMINVLMQEYKVQLAHFQDQLTQQWDDQLGCRILVQSYAHVTVLLDTVVAAWCHAALEHMTQHSHKCTETVKHTCHTIFT